MDVVMTQQYHAAGAIDALTLLDKYIAPGCVLLFDDLVNYPNYRDHEILALWEWLQDTGRKLEVRAACHVKPINSTQQLCVIPCCDVV